MFGENKTENYDNTIKADQRTVLLTDGVRLVNGGSRCAGRVEVLHDGQWGTVCGSAWDIKDAAVVCRQLQCENVRLSAGPHRCSGRVEVYHGGSWSTVCDADFDQQDAEVVCRELGCGIPVKVLGSAAFGRGKGQVWTEELQCRGNESEITFCPTSSSLKHSHCSHDNDVGLICSGTVRLVNGGSRCVGRVEVLHNGQWGTVCDDYWELREAAVVCRELHCGEPVNVRYFAHFGEGSGPIWMNDVGCSGSELTLKNCTSTEWGKNDCNHGGDAGVTCSENKPGDSNDEQKTVIPTESVRVMNGGSHCAGRVEVLHDGQWGTVCGTAWDMKDAAVVCRELHCHRMSRLRAGHHLCSGRVEVFHGHSWSTVCDADFDQQDAEVVCRELGCGIPVEMLGSAAFGRGKGQVWTEVLQCRGNESEIAFCPTSSQHSDCSHDNDVGLICSAHTKAQLVNGLDSCSGRVELQYLSDWGTVCTINWDMRAADVLCAQLNCGSAVDVVGMDWFGEGKGHIWADVFDCQGNETHLSQCDISSWSRASCSHKHDAGVICNGSSVAFHEGRVQLSGGSECQGEVEIYFRQDWRRVLLDLWSLSEVSVLCRQLGCGSVLNYRSSPSTTEHKNMCVTGFRCSGSEAHLGNCSGAQPVNCSSGEQLYITCSGTQHNSPRSIRLVGSGGDCAGRLEVLHSGSWGTVCDDSWDIKDAQVVCRQLQCGVALNTPIPAWFGPGTGSIWLNEMECKGNETSLWNCRFQLCEEGECGHHEDVGVMCSEFKEMRLTEGCNGNLEVFYNGTWGNVCHNQMDDETVNVVCRELNCGRLKYLDSEGARVDSAPNWLDHVKCRKHDSYLLKCPSLPWGQNSCDNRDEVAHITCTEHWSLRLSGGKGSCSGRLEVYHNATWGSVCDDQWNIRNAQVVCRQLGCGSALSADRNVSFGPGEGTIWLNRVKCRGDEIHLWDCHHSLKKHTDCSHAGVTCAGQRGRAAPNPPPAVAPPTSPLVLFVLGTLLFLALVLLVEFCAAAETLLVPELIRYPDQEKFKESAAYIENR
ncbi:scavenger receptor cysteine-rich type 1 protein M130-like [Clarias gariepinus]